MASKLKQPVNAWMKKPPFSDAAFAMMTAKAKPDGTVSLCGVTLAEVMELGVRLTAVQSGRMSADVALHAPKRRRGKPNLEHERFAIPMGYYGRLAREGAEHASHIASEIASHYNKSAATIQRIARANQHWALDELQRNRVPGIAALRDHLAKKSKGGNRTQ